MKTTGLKMSSITVFALCTAAVFIQVNYSEARRTYTVINGPPVYYTPVISQGCGSGSSYYNLPPFSYDSYDLSYPTSISSYSPASICNCDAVSTISSYSPASICNCDAVSSISSYSPTSICNCDAVSSIISSPAIASVPNCFPATSVCSCSPVSTISIPASVPCCSPVSTISSFTPVSSCPTTISNSIPTSCGYGGEGSGRVSITGDVNACGTTSVSGSVPVIGTAGFSGKTPVCGSVSISGQCGCDCS